MNKFSLLFLILIISGCTFKKRDVKVTYVANCAFLYETQSSKVLIDPFGTEFGNFFFLPTDKTKINIEKGNALFDNIDLVLITHIHGDHFNPFLAEKFLLKNKEAKMICPPQVLSQIKDSCIHFKQIESQIISPQLSMNNLETLSINDIAITAVKMQHGTTRSLEGIDYNDFTDYEKTENFGYLVELNHKFIFHQGDASLKINEIAINKLNRKVDIAFLSYFDWDSLSYHILKEKLCANHTIFMHGTKPAKELETGQLKQIELNLTFFNHELESKTFE